MEIIKNVSGNVTTIKITNPSRKVIEFIEKLKEDKAKRRKEIFNKKNE